MKKTLLTLTLALSLLVSSAPAMAANKAEAEPDVIVNGSAINFADQSAKIIDGFTLVPARGVFEAMGFTVEWDGDTRTVEVTSDTGVRTVYITIDSKVLNIHTFKSLMEIEKKEFTLEVPAQILNDRTMIPLRAVSEAFGADVRWDNDAYCVTITSGPPILLEGYTPEEEPEVDTRPALSLSTDATDVKAGDEVIVYVNLDNIPENAYLSNISATFTYNKDEFEYVANSGSLINNADEAFGASLFVENPDFSATSAKAIFIIIDGSVARSTNGKIFKATFKAKTDNGGTIALSNAYNTELGYDTSVDFATETETETVDTTYDGTELNIDLTPVKVD